MELQNLFQRYAVPGRHSINFLHSREARSRVVLLWSLLPPRSNKDSTARTLCIFGSWVWLNVSHDILRQKTASAPDETFHVWCVAGMYNFYSVHFHGPKSFQSQNKTRRTTKYYNLLWSKPSELIQSCSNHASEWVVPLDFYLGAHNRHKHLPLCWSLDARSLPLQSS